MSQKFISDKEFELREVLIDRLYRYFVLEKKESRIDTIVLVLSALSDKEGDKEIISEASKNFEEVDII